MKRYRALYYKKNPMINITAAIFSIMFIVLAVFIATNFETIAADSYLVIGFLIITPYTLFMLLRALYLIFETVEIDETKKEIRFRLLRKSIALTTVKGIRRVRPGQFRIEAADSIVPFSVEDEEEFIGTIRKLSPSIAIHQYPL